MERERICTSCVTVFPTYYFGSSGACFECYLYALTRRQPIDAPIIDPTPAAQVIARLAAFPALNSRLTVRQRQLAQALADCGSLSEAARLMSLKLNAASQLCRRILKTIARAA